MSKPTRDYLTEAQQRFLLALADIGCVVTGEDVQIYCPEEREEYQPPSTDKYLDTCGNLEHFWLCFGDQADFYIIPQSGPVMELIADWTISDAAEAIYRQLEEEFGE